MWQLARRLNRPAHLGTLRRTAPLSDQWGYDRGTPIDRYYIEGFLAQHRDDICGTVLEVQDDTYTQRFGTNVTRHEVLDIDPTNRKATVIADLAAAHNIPSDSFDCFILTQTLQLIYDTRACLFHAHRLLRSGGRLLVTVPGVSRIVPPQDGPVDYWRFTVDSCSAVFGEVFRPARVSVSAYGNVLTSIAFLTGMALEELTRHELEVQDRYFPLIVAVRAVKL
jgi:hypothetical protein